MISPLSIPHLPKIPIFGNLLAFRRDRLALLLETSRVCGDVGIFHVGSWPVVLVNAPAFIDIVLVERAADFEKSPMLRRHLRPILGDGLLTSDNATNRRHRTIIGPTFQRERLLGYSEVFTSYATALVNRWQDGMTINIADEMLTLTLAIVGKTLFGADLWNAVGPVGKALTEIVRYGNSVANDLIDLPHTWPLPRNRRLRRALDELESLIARLVAECRQQPSPDRDLLALLLQARDAESGAGLTDSAIRDEVLTFFLAGHETTAMALAWTWYLLSQHPEVEARLHAELDSVLGGRPPTVADLPQLPYTLQVLQEALRLYPPAYIIMRQAQRPVALGPYTLQPGTSVAISPYVMHRQPTYFPEPEQFNPDRFASGQERRWPRHAYLPFGGGPRRCIGQHFALLEAHLILATMAQRVTFELLPGQTITPEPLMTLRPRGGIAMRVKVRH